MTTATFSRADAASARRTALSKSKSTSLDSAMWTSVPTRFAPRFWSAAASSSVLPLTPEASPRISSTFAESGRTFPFAPAGIGSLSRYFCAIAAGAANIISSNAASFTAPPGRLRTAETSGASG
jgi:hypothetical protein